MKFTDFSDIGNSPPRAFQWYNIRLISISLRYSKIYYNTVLKSRSCIPGRFIDFYDKIDNKFYKN